MIPTKRTNNVILADVTIKDAYFEQIFMAKQRAYEAPREIVWTSEVNHWTLQLRYGYGQDPFSTPSFRISSFKSALNDPSVEYSTDI